MFEMEKILIFAALIGGGIFLGGVLLMKQYRSLIRAGGRSMVAIPLLSGVILGIGALMLLGAVGGIGYHTWIHHVPPADLVQTGVWVESSDKSEASFVVDGREYRIFRELMQEKGYRAHTAYLDSLPKEAVFSEKRKYRSHYFVPPSWHTYYRVEHEGGFDLVWRGGMFAYYRADEEQKVLEYLQTAPVRYYLEDGEEHTTVLPEAVWDDCAQVLDGSLWGNVTHVSASALNDVRILRETPMNGLLCGEGRLIARLYGEYYAVGVTEGEREKLGDYSCAIYRLPAELDQVFEKVWEA